jgi:hypothetical protein
MAARRRSFILSFWDFEAIFWVFEMIVKGGFWGDFYTRSELRKQQILFHFIRYGIS